MPPPGPRLAAREDSDALLAGYNRRVDLAEFRTSLDSECAPDGLGLALRALWTEARGDWDDAHELAGRDEGRAGAWVHAYLHRKEGDLGNARYWYERAGRRPSDAPLEREWEEIATALLAHGGSRALRPADPETHERSR